MFKSLFRTASRGLSPHDFKTQRTDDDVVIDVRTESEYTGGHVAGSENIDLAAPDFRHRIDALDRSTTYYLYCRSGNRSGTAAQIMKSMGFSDVHNIGGLSALARAGVETSR